MGPALPVLAALLRTMMCTKATTNRIAFCMKLVSAVRLPASAALCAAEQTTQKKSDFRAQKTRTDPQNPGSYQQWWSAIRRHENCPGRFRV